MRQTVFGSAAVILLAGAASASQMEMPEYAASDLGSVAFYFSATSGPEIDGGQPAQFGPITDWAQSVFNATGFDWISAQYKIIPDPKETYAPGEFELLTIDQGTDPTVEGSPAPGTTQPFNVTYSPNGQAVTFLFSEADPHSLFESLSYTFRVLNDTGRNIGYGLQFTPVPVPVPGSLALVGLAGLVATRRKR